MKNIPMTYQYRVNKNANYFLEKQKSHKLNRVEHMNIQLEDRKQINKFCEVLFEYHPQKIFFEEFVKLNMEVTSELYMCIFD